jgi:cell division protein FtsW
VARPTRPQATPSAAPSNSPPRGTLITVRRIFASETGNYFLLLGVTVFLVAFGLVMVLSSSSIESRVQNNSFFTAFLRQGLYALVAIPLMLVASRMPITFWKRMARPAIVLGIGLQLLIFTPLSYEYGGNRNWITLAPGLNLQPSEFAKLALIVWIAFALSRPLPENAPWTRRFVPILAASAVSVGLVLYGSDLGTAIIMGAVIFGTFFFSGVKLRYLLGTGAAVAILGTMVAFASDSRTKRINSWLYGCSVEDYYDFCWQPMHGTWALASGGVLGVGLGNSKAKWSWLPEADNDYIFAIIGEELGLVGAIVVLLLFIVLAIAFFRIYRSNPDPFARVVTSGVMVWIIGQALVNIAVVLGLLPVLGVPLPLISAGGSALISTLLSIGVVLSFARQPVSPLETGQPLTPAERSRLAAAERLRSR